MMIDKNTSKYILRMPISSVECEQDDAEKARYHKGCNHPQFFLERLKEFHG